MRNLKVLVGFCFLALLASVGFTSCEKDMGPPSISFVEGSEFITQDTILMVGDTVSIGLLLEWNGTNKLSQLEVYVSNTLVDTYSVEIQDRMEVVMYLTKSASALEEWEFILYDSKGNTASQTIKLTKDPNSIFGGIQSYQNVKLGAQSNISVPGFLGFKNQPTSFNIDAAFAEQESIDLLYFYDPENGATIASPGANISHDIFGGDHGLANWTTKNTTKFLKTDLSPEAFNQMFHDGNLVTLFDEEKAQPKAIILEIGIVYMFQTSKGLLGGMLLNEIDGTLDGFIDFNLIIQDK